MDPTPNTPPVTPDAAARNGAAPDTTAAELRIIRGELAHLDVRFTALMLLEAAAISVILLAYAALAIQLKRSRQ